ncbi:hypothetical protein ART_2493 [Arthrobacter sp. PAMC 25486]|nr:hypothetical protein ART_2493 [Arthrobacter sp. PAMC 25486]
MLISSFSGTVSTVEPSAGAVPVTASWAKAAVDVPKNTSKSANIAAKVRRTSIFDVMFVSLSRRLTGEITAEIPLFVG